MTLTFSKETRARVLSRAAGRCERCGLPSFGYEFHHRRPRGMGGSKRADTNTVSNCLLLCTNCHREVEADRAEALEHGWLIRQQGTPCEAPVFRRGTWVILSDDGAITAAREGE